MGIRQLLSARFGAVLIVAFVLCLALVMPAAAFGATGVERAADAVIAVTAGDELVGSAIVVAPGYVLSAAHVVGAASETGRAQLLINDRRLPFDVVAVDVERDLALLRAKLPSTRPIAWGDSRGLRRGQDVIVLGFPIGLESVSLTKGVVSSPMQSYEGRPYVQTDAAINPGNSGGAMVDDQGRLVGMSVAKIADVSVDSVGFAVPADSARQFVIDNAPGISLDRPKGAPRSEGGAGASEASGTPWVPIALTATAIAAGLGAGSLLRRGRRSAGSDESATAAPVDSMPMAKAVQDSQRRSFRILDPAGERTLDVRLPAVIGAADNADIQVRGAGIAPYHARLSVVPEGVLALALEGVEGLYCGESCSLEVIVHPGESMRLGAAHVVLLP